MDNIGAATTGQHTPICNSPLYLAVTFEQLVQFENCCRISNVKIWKGQYIIYTGFMNNNPAIVKTKHIELSVSNYHWLVLVNWSSNQTKYPLKQVECQKMIYFTGTSFDTQDTFKFTFKIMNKKLAHICKHFTHPFHINSILNCWVGK